LSTPTTYARKKEPATRGPGSFFHTGKSMKTASLASIITLLALAFVGSADEQKDNTPPPGFTALFNGKDLTNWKGLVEIGDRQKLTPEELEKKQEQANKLFLPHWSVKDGVLVYDGKG